MESLFLKKKNSDIMPTIIINRYAEDAMQTIW